MAGQRQPTRAGANVNVFDTAPVFGSSQAAIGAASSSTVARKGSPWTGPDPLAQALRFEVIPQLVSRWRRPEMIAIAPGEGPAVAVATAELVAQIARLVLDPSDSAAHDVQRLCAGATSAEAACHDLLAPAARLLGELWEDDRVDFTQVTIGVWRLQQLARELQTLPEAVPAAQPAHGHAILVPAPGDQHSFGRFLVGAAFRRAGWLVDDEVSCIADELGHRVESTWFDVVGFSLGSPRGLEEVHACIRALRGASCNPAVGVLVGGPLFVGNPGLAHELGADGTAADGVEAVHRAATFAGRLIGR